MKEVIVPADDLVCLGKEKLQEVIRCKDCEWYINNILKADGTEDKRFKRSWCEIHRMETNDYGYCHLAYRRKDEGIHSDNREGS